jgi:UPF0755 protein
VIKKSTFYKLLAIAGGVLVVVAIVIGYTYYRYLYAPNVKTKESKVFVNIPTGSDFTSVVSLLSKRGILVNPESFVWVAKRKNYPSKIKPGRYSINSGMSNNELVNLLRSGRQVPVKVRFQNVRNTADFAGIISRQIEADSAELIKLLRDPDFLGTYDVTPATSFVLFIPNTYEFYWNTSAREFFERMNREKRKFWNENRLKLAETIGLGMKKVIILASIVEKESSKDAERPTIAGVYMNRLRKNWPLQADPTLIFAWGDYSIKRLYKKHTEIDSPYNTYKNTGLPPGPICLPSISSIEAVLHYQHHNYMFFCAREDLSGYHAFATSYQEHQLNARRYQRAISKLNIR